LSSNALGKQSTKYDEEAPSVSNQLFSQFQPNLLSHQSSRENENDIQNQIDPNFNKKLDGYKNLNETQKNDFIGIYGMLQMRQYVFENLHNLSPSEKILEVKDKLLQLYPSLTLLTYLQTPPNDKKYSYSALLLCGNLEHEDNYGRMFRFLPILKDFGVVDENNIKPMMEYTDKERGEIVHNFRKMIFEIQIFLIYLNIYIIGPYVKLNKTILPNNFFFTLLDNSDWSNSIGDLGPKTKFTLLHFDANWMFVPDIIQNIKIKFRQISEIFSPSQLSNLDYKTRWIIEVFGKLTIIEIQHLISSTDFPDDNNPYLYLGLIFEPLEKLKLFNLQETINNKKNPKNSDNLPIQQNIVDDHNDDSLDYIKKIKQLKSENKSTVFNGLKGNECISLNQDIVMQENLSSAESQMIDNIPLIEDEPNNIIQNLYSNNFNNIKGNLDLSISNKTKKQKFDFPLEEESFTHKEKKVNTTKDIDWDDLIESIKKLQEILRELNIFENETNPFESESGQLKIKTKLALYVCICHLVKAYREINKN
jgi:hypothetical protein